MINFNLSARQFVLLKKFQHNNFSLDNARRFNQTTFGSILNRGYISYDRAKEIFSINNNGLDALERYFKVEVTRKAINARMTHYFSDPKEFKRIQKQINKLYLVA